MDTDVFLVVASLHRRLLRSRYCMLLVVTHGKFGISVFVSQTCFGKKTSRGVANCHLSLLTKGFLFIASSFGSVIGGDFMYNFPFVL